MMNVVNTLDESRWGSYIERHPLSNVFHTPEMYQVYSQAKGHMPSLWAVVDRQNQPLAMFMPVQVSIAGGPLKRLTTRSIVYGSVLCNPGAEGETALSYLLETYKRECRQGSLFTELRNVCDLGHFQPVLDKAGFSYREHLNYLIDLDCSKKELLERLGARTRKHIRRAIRKKELVIEEITQKSQMKTFYDILRKTYMRARVFLADRTLFEAAFDVLYPKGMVRFLLVRLGDTPIAISAELLFKKTIFGWYGGLDRSFGGYNANELLTWHILEWGVDKGYKVYDFGGAGEPEEEYGVRDFKAKFKGEMVNFGRNVCVHSPGLLRVSQTGYSVYQFFMPGRRLSKISRSPKKIDTDM